MIQGRNLLSDFTTTAVQIGSVLVTPVPPAIVTNSTITMPIPAGVQAGVLGVQVIQQLQVGTPPKSHPGFDSNVLAMVLHPVITPGTVSSTQITVNITPAVQAGQRVALLLNQVKLPPPPALPAAYTFTLPPPTASTSTLNFAITGVLGGGTQYFIRVSVDGAESPLNPDPTIGPTVTIP